MGGLRHLIRLAVLILLSALALQLYFLSRIAFMRFAAPESTTFQRSEAWRLMTHAGPMNWRQAWVPYAQISPHLKRAVITSEDAGFAEHSGVDWDALEKAWERNQKAQERAEQINEKNIQAAQKALAKGKQTVALKAPVQPKVFGGSTISQQLARNLFLASERSLTRKGQEFIITFMLEGLLSKQRLLEIYLNNVEWGQGIFGAQAAAIFYNRAPASQLGAFQSAQLAVMLPAPKRFEKKRDSAYLLSRAHTIQARMVGVDLP